MSIIANVKRQMANGILNFDVKDDVPILGHNTEKKFAACTPLTCLVHLIVFLAKTLDMPAEWRFLLLLEISFIKFFKTRQRLWESIIVQAWIC